MFNLYNFIFQRLIWKIISVYFLWFDYWTLKESKTAKVQNHSVSAHWIFPQMIGPLKIWHDYYYHVYYYYLFFTRLLNMCKPITTLYLIWRGGPPGLTFYGSGPEYLPSCLGMVNVKWLLQIKFIIFQGYPTKRVAFFPGQPDPYNRFFTHPLLLFPERYFA